MLPETKHAIDSLEAAMAAGYLHPAVDKQAAYIKQLITVAKYFMPNAESAQELRVILAAATPPAPGATGGAGEAAKWLQMADCQPTAGPDGNLRYPLEYPSRQQLADALRAAAQLLAAPAHAAQ